MTIVDTEPASEDLGVSEQRRLRSGWRIVAAKELGDNIRSVRLPMLFGIFLVAAAASVLDGVSEIRNLQSSFGGFGGGPPGGGFPGGGFPGGGGIAGILGGSSVFLRMLTLSIGALPSFSELIGFVGPIIGIALGLDAVSGERSQSTLPRLASHPIHRDDIVNGKVAAGSASVGIALVSIIGLLVAMITAGLGYLPGLGEVGRLIAFTAVSVLYVTFWLIATILASVIARRAATAALVAIALWLVLTLFSPILIGAVADFVAPAGDTFASLVRNAETEQFLSRLSPTMLYEETTAALLDPSVRTLDVAPSADTSLAVESDLSLGQTLLLVWGQIVTLIAAVAATFAATYLIFMRQEIRA